MQARRKKKAADLLAGSRTADSAAPMTGRWSREEDPPGGAAPALPPGHGAAAKVKPPLLPPDSGRPPSVKEGDVPHTSGGSLALLAAAKFKRKLKAKDEDDEHVEDCECIDCQEKREKAAFTSA
jgi:hypothetical protein